MDIQKFIEDIPCGIHALSSHSRPPVHSTLVERVSIMDCLLRLAVVRRSRNEFSITDLCTVEHHRVQFLPAVYNDDIIFELPPCRSSSSSLTARNLEGMDKRYNGHLWCKSSKVLTTNILNNDNLKFCKSYYAGHLHCKNLECGYLKRASKKNKTEWTGYTTFFFVVGDSPPKD